MSTNTAQVYDPHLPPDQVDVTGWHELGFVDEKIAGNVIERVWWCPPTIEASENPRAQLAPCILGKTYGLQFVGYLRRCETATGYDASDDLTRIVEAMTGKSLGMMEKSFLNAVSEALMDRETVIACTPDDKVVGVCTPWQETSEPRAS